MKGESDAESAGKHTLRVVVVVSGEDKDGMPVTDAEENTEGEPPFEVWAEAHISDDTIIDTLSETVEREIGSDALLDAAKEMLEALGKRGSKWGDWKVAPLATTIKSHSPWESCCAAKAMEGSTFSVMVGSFAPVIVLVFVLVSPLSGS